MENKFLQYKGHSFGKIDDPSPMIDDIVNSVLHEESNKHNEPEDSIAEKHIAMLDLTSGIESSEH